jgi:hypothetical protein
LASSRSSVVVFGFFRFVAASHAGGGSGGSLLSHTATFHCELAGILVDHLGLIVLPECGFVVNHANGLDSLLNCTIEI